MKKIIVSLILICTMAGVSMAQPRAIGARLGGNVEFSYQHDLAGGAMFVELTAGASNYWSPWGSVGVASMFDWVWGIGASNWNWYVGPGVGVGFNYGAYWREHDYLPVTLAFGAQLGIEYQFSIPLNISLDWRPMVNVLGFVRGHEFPIYNNFYSVALGLRYRF
ncbi:MAG: hypothetical protein J6S56_04525 [Bacteroidales bacterium]|nr:hypothetical protein [Bacteroidales bacterium]